MTSVATVESWDRQKGESAKAYQAFALYRDMGVTRKLSKVAGELGKSTNMMGQWSSRWRWVERAEAYDMLLDRRRREAVESEVEAMTRRHIGAGQVAQRLAIQRLQGDPERNVPALNAASLDAGDAARLLDLGIRIERMSRGMPTEVIKGAFSIRPDELQTWVRDICELSLSFIAEDRRDAYMNAIYGLVEGRLQR